MISNYFLCLIHLRSAEVWVCFDSRWEEQRPPEQGFGECECWRDPLRLAGRNEELCPALQTVALQTAKPWASRQQSHWKPPQQICGWLERQRVCYGLYEECPPQANLFEHLVPNWWYCFERLRTLSEVGSNWRTWYPSSVLSGVIASSCLLQQCDVVSFTSSLRFCCCAFPTGCFYVPRICEPGYILTQVKPARSFTVVMKKVTHRVGMKMKHPSLFALPHLPFYHPICSSTGILCTPVLECHYFKLFSLHIKSHLWWHMPSQSLQLSSLLLWLSCLYFPLGVDSSRLHKWIVYWLN